MGTAMLRLLAAVLLSGALMALPAFAEAPAGPDLLLPGTFSEHTTVADLEARFGKANLRIIEAGDGAGSTSRSIVLFPDDATRRAHVQFHDSQKMTGVRRILVSEPGSRWRGKHGVRVGMSFAELRRVNGKRFWFNGFDSEHRGAAQDQWSPADEGDGGRLGALDVEQGDRMYFGVELGVRAQAGKIAAGALPIDEYVSSDDPRYPQLGELVEVTAIHATTSLDDEW